MIESSPIPGGKHIRLPPRRVPWAVGVVLIIVGTAVTSFMFFWMSGPMGWFDPPPVPREVEKSAPAQGSGIDAAGIAFGLLGLPMLLLGIGLMIAGVVLVTGITRCSLEVDEQEMRCREHVGWLRWTWRVPLPAIRALCLAAMNGAPVRATGGNGEDAGALLLRCADGPDRWWAAGYPQALLQRLAADIHACLHSRIDVPWQSDPATGVPPGDLVVHEDHDALVIRNHRPWLSTGLRVGMVVAAIAVVVAWLAAWHFGWGVGMVAAFVTMVTLMILLPALTGRLRAACWPATVRISGGVVDVSHLRGAGTFPAVHQAYTQELGTGSDRYRAISLRDGDNAMVGELRWPGGRVTQAWIARRISWFLQGGRGDVPNGAPPAIEVPVQSSWTPVAGTGAEVSALLLPHPACRGQAVFGVVFIAFAGGFGAVVRAVTGELPLIGIPILGLFMVFGVVCAWTGLRGSTRRTAVRLRDGVLEIEQRDWCSRLERTITAADVVGVHAEPTGTRINDWTVHRLRLVLRDGTRLDLGNQAKPEEIRNVAGDLARSLGVADGSGS